MGSWPPAVEARRILPAASLGAHTNPHDYDALVYCLGASRFHVDTLVALRRCPGIVWVHDANLIGLYLEWAERVRWARRYGWCGERETRTIDDILREEARATYGGRVPTDLFSTTRDYADYVETGVRFAASAVAGAKHVIVNSAIARDLIMDDLARAGRGSVSITVLAHAVPDRTTVASPASSRPARPTIVSLGFCVARKQPQLIVEAVAALADDVDLVFVGSCAPALEREIRTRAQQLGVGDRVRVTGYVSDAEYREWLARARCAVQLRAVDFGESTGTVHDAIAARLPVITSVQSCRELPAGTVVDVAPAVTAGELAQTLRAVLFDDNTRHGLDEAMHEYARSWTFADVARRVTEIVESVIPAPSRQFVRTT
jgi:glycosyltransferase involved in cell wall biosynthesis